jgi:hypothetical protein
MNTTHELPLNGKFYGRTDTGKLLHKDLENQDARIMPEMKISFEGRKIYANPQAEKFLERLGIAGLEQKFFTAKYPYLLKMGINENFEISSGQFIFYFTAVAFEEAEYIGLYCYRVSRNKIYQ